MRKDLGWGAGRDFVLNADGTISMRIAPHLRLGMRGLGRTSKADTVENQDRLVAAAQRGELDEMNRLLALGVSCNWTNAEGSSPLPVERGGGSIACPWRSEKKSSAHS